MRPLPIIFAGFYMTFFLAAESQRCCCAEKLCRAGLRHGCIHRCILTLDWCRNARVSERWCRRVQSVPRDMHIHTHRRRHCWHYPSRWHEPCCGSDVCFFTVGPAQWDSDNTSVTALLHSCVEPPAERLCVLARSFEQLPRDQLVSTARSKDDTERSWKS